MALLESRRGDSADRSTTSRDLVAIPADQRLVTRTTENGEEKLSSSARSPPLLAAAAGSTTETRLVLAGGGEERSYNPQEGATMNVTAVQENEKGQERDEKESREAEEELALASPPATSHVDRLVATGSPMAALPPLEATTMHLKLEGTASREKRQRQEKILAKKPPPVDPPEDVDLARRRGGLGG